MAWWDEYTAPAQPSRTAKPKAAKRAWWEEYAQPTEEPAPGGLAPMPEPAKLSPFPDASWVDATMDDYTRTREGLDRLHAEAREAGVPLGRATQWKRKQLEKQALAGALPAPERAGISLADVNVEDPIERDRIIALADEIQSSRFSQWQNPGEETTIPGEGESRDLTTALNVLEGYRRQTAPEVPGSQFLRQLVPRAVPRAAPEAPARPVDRSAFETASDLVASAGSRFAQGLANAGVAGLEIAEGATRQTLRPEIADALQAAKWRLRGRGAERDAEGNLRDAGGLSADSIAAFADELQRSQMPQRDGSVLGEIEYYANAIPGEIGRMAADQATGGLLRRGAGAAARRFGRTLSEGESTFLQMAPLSAGVAGNAYQEARARGLTPSEASAEMGKALGSELIPELIGVSAILGKLPVGKAAQRTISGRTGIAAGAEAGTELITAEAQIANEDWLRQRLGEAPLTEQEKQQMRQDALVIGAAAGGVLGGGAAALELGPGKLMERRFNRMERDLKGAIRPMSDGARAIEIEQTLLDQGADPAVAAGAGSVAAAFDNARSTRSLINEPTGPFSMPSAPGLLRTRQRLPGSLQGAEQPQVDMAVFGMQSLPRAMQAPRFDEDRSLAEQLASAGEIDQMMGIAPQAMPQSNAPVALPQFGGTAQTGGPTLREQRQQRMADAQAQQARPGGLLAVRDDQAAERGQAGPAGDGTSLPAGVRFADVAGVGSPGGTVGGVRPQGPAAAGQAPVALPSLRQRGRGFLPTRKVDPAVRPFFDEGDEVLGSRTPDLTDAQRSRLDALIAMPGGEMTDADRREYAKLSRIRDARRKSEAEFAPSGRRYGEAPEGAKMFGTFMGQRDMDAVAPEVADAFLELAQSPKARQLPTSVASELEKIAADVDPEVRITRESPRNLDPGVREGYIIRMRDGNQAYLNVEEDGTLQLNAIELEQGQSGGAALYNIVNRFAAANNYKAEPDRNGLTNINIYRRTEQQAASALREGTTRHLGTAKAQGVTLDRALPDKVNIGRLLLTGMGNVIGNVLEADQMSYNFDTGQFQWSNGEVVDDADFRAIAGSELARDIGAGVSTIKRAVFAASVVRATRAGARGADLGKTSREQLEQLASPALVKMLYSKPGRQPARGDARLGVTGTAVAPSGREQRALVERAWSALEDGLGKRAVARLRDTVLTVVPTRSALPQRVQETMSQDYLYNGLYHVGTGKAYIIADELDTDPTNVALHEVGIHYGLRTMMGGRAEQLIEEFQALADKGDAKVAWALGRAEDAGTPQEYMIEEAIAYYVERYASERSGLAAKIVDAIRAWLNQTLKIPLSVLGADTVIGVARGAMNRAGRGQVPEGAKDMALASKRAAKQARVLFEVAPNPDDAGLKARWDKLSQDAKTETSIKIARKILPEILALVGLPKTPVRGQIGGYLDDSNPSLALTLEGKAVDQAAKIIEATKLAGFALSQQSMMVLSDRAFDGSFETGVITIKLPESVRSIEQVHSVYQQVRALDPDMIQGHTTVEGEMVLAVPTEARESLEARIAKTLPGDYDVASAIGHMAFPSERDYDYGADTAESTAELSDRREDARRLRAEASRLLDLALPQGGVGTLASARPAVGGRGTAGVRPAEGRQGVEGLPVFRNRKPGPTAVSATGVHYSPVAGLTSLDPTQAGSQFAGAERRRFGSGRFGLQNPRLNFYVEEDGTRPEREAALATATNVYKVRLENLYDFEADPDGLRADAGMNVDAFEESVTDAGYDGVLYPPVPGIPSRTAVLFGFKKKVPVQAQDAVLASARPRTINVDGKERPTTDSTGKQIHPTEEGLRNFWRWFGDSKVVDDEGRPLVVYHGTTRAGFDTFSTGRGSKVDGAYFFTPNPRMAATYSGTQREIAADEFGEGAKLRRLYRAYLKLTSDDETYFEGANWDGTNANPRYELYDEDGDIVDTVYSISEAEEAVDSGRADRYEESTDLFMTTDSEVRNAMRYGGDGIILRHVVDDGPEMDNFEASDVYVVFSPQQIKSAGLNSGAFDPTDPSILASTRRRAAAWQQTKDAAAEARGLTQRLRALSSAATRLRQTVIDAAEKIERVRGYYRQAKELIADFEKGLDAEWRSTEAALKARGLRSKALDGDRQAMRELEKLTVEREAIKAEIAAAKRASAKASRLLEAAERTKIPDIEPLIGQLKRLGAVIPMLEDATTRARKLRDWWKAREDAYYGTFDKATDRREDARRGLGVGIGPAVPNSSAFEIKATESGLKWTGWRAWRRKTRRALQDRMIAWRDVQKDVIEQGGMIDDLSDVYTLETLMHGRAQRQLETAEQDIIEPMLETIAKHKLSIGEVEDYLEARYAQYRNEAVERRNRENKAGSGMTTEDANDYLAGKTEGLRGKQKLTPEKRRQLKEAEAKVRELTKLTRDKMLASGLIDKDLHDTLSKDELYVPLRHIKEGETAAGDGFLEGLAMDLGLPTPTMADLGTKRGSGRGLDTRSAGLQRALGRTTRAESIIGELIGNYQKAVLLGEKNRAAQGILRMALQNRAPSLWSVEKVETELKYSEATGIAYRAAKVNTQDPQTMAVFVDGVRYHVWLQEDLARAAKRMAEPELNAALAASGWVNRTLSNLYTNLSPTFALVNPIRDAQLGLTRIADDHGAATAAAATKGWAPARGALRALLAGRKDGAGTTLKLLSQAERDRWLGYAKEFTDAGAMTGYVQALRPDQIEQRSARQLKAATGEGAYGKVARPAKIAARYTVELVSAMNTANENALRLSAYVALREKGLTVNQAARYAKDLTVNFNRKGEIGTQINALSLFYNAAVQGSHAVLKTITGKSARRMLATAAALQAVLVFFAMDDYDEETGERNYDKLTEWEKQRNFIIPIGGGEFLKIPTGYGLNLFPYLGTKVAEVARRALDGDSDLNVWESIGQFTGAVGTAFIPIETTLPGAFVPSAVRPIVDAAIGVNSFTGGYIAPPEAYDRYPTARAESYYPGTPGWAVATARAMWLVGTGFSAETRTEKPIGPLDWSPNEIEYIVKQYTGGPGQMFGGVAQAAVDMLSGQMPKADNPLNIPGRTLLTSVKDPERAVGGQFKKREQKFMRLVDEGKAIYMDRGEDAWEEFKERHAEYLSGVEIEEATRSGQETLIARKEDGFAAALKDVSRELRELRIARRAVINDTSLSLGERRRQSDEIEAQIAALQRQALLEFNTGRGR